jgi:hypothetical protein
MKPAYARAILIVLIVSGAFFFEGKSTVPLSTRPETTQRGLNKELQPIDSIMVRGHLIAIGTTADDVFAVLTKADEITEPASRESEGQLVVAHTYKYAGRTLMIAFSRIHDPGPFVVVNMMATSN